MAKKGKKMKITEEVNKLWEEYNQESERAHESIWQTANENGCTYEEALNLIVAFFDINAY